MSSFLPTVQVCVYIAQFGAGEWMVKPAKGGRDDGAGAQEGGVEVEISKNKGVKVYNSIFWPVCTVQGTNTN